MLPQWIRRRSPSPRVGLSIDPAYAALDGNVRGGSTCSKHEAETEQQLQLGKAFGLLGKTSRALSVSPQPAGSAEG